MTIERGHLKLVEMEPERFKCDFGYLYIRRETGRWSMKKESLIYNGDLGDRWHLTKIITRIGNSLFIPDYWNLQINENFHRKSHRVGNKKFEYSRATDEDLVRILSCRFNPWNESSSFVGNYLNGLSLNFLKEEELFRIWAAIGK